jgi:hypothetical protein
VHRGLYASTVSRRPVRGSPALRLQRRLLPPTGTSLDWAVCRPSQGRRPDRGSHVPRSNPRCFRWSAVPLTARTPRRFGSRRVACPWRAHPVFPRGTPGSGCMLVEDELTLHTEDSSADFNELCFTMAPSVARPRRYSRHSRAVQAARLLQAADPISATFAAPFCTRPDPGEDEFIRSSVFPQISCRTRGVVGSDEIGRRWPITLACAVGRGRRRRDRRRRDSAHIRPPNRTSGKWAGSRCRPAWAISPIRFSDLRAQVIGWAP